MYALACTRFGEEGWMYMVSGFGEVFQRSKKKIFSWFTVETDAREIATGMT